MTKEKKVKCLVTCFDVRAGKSYKVVHEYPHGWITVIDDANEPFDLRSDQYEQES